MRKSIALLLSAVAAVKAQGVGSNAEETLPMTWQQCSGAGSCQSVSGKVTMDANWRWTHVSGKPTKEGNCYLDNQWQSSACASDDACSKQCVVEGLKRGDYQSTYGVSTSGNALTLGFVTNKNIGSRLYMLNGTDRYHLYTLPNKEFSFDVDLSTVGCGLNAALYFVSMDADGGASKYKQKAGAKFGTGYCDAQCPRDLKFINGKANMKGWTPADKDPGHNTGIGPRGSCCVEMDIWEANYVSNALTPHACKEPAITQHECNGDDCGGTYSTTRYAGYCDADGCDFNPYRMGDTTYYGKGAGHTVDTSKKFTVVTQFVGSPIKEIKRFYIQNGKVIPNAESKIPGVTGNSITPEFCDAQKKVFGDNYGYKEKGGWDSLTKAGTKGMVLVMSLWDDMYADMNWLDSTWPLENPDAPGAKRGGCDSGVGKPASVRASSGSAKVIYSNIRHGPLGSTYKGLPKS